MAARDFINREMSWIEFNARVLEEAQDASLPLLERVKFLAITSSNLDEFFMVRVGGLQLMEEQKLTKRDPAGMTPGQQLAAISKKNHALVEAQYACYRDDIVPALAEQGVRRVRPDELTPEQADYISEVFEQEILPILSPMGIDPEGDQPLLTNRQLYMAIRLKDGAGEAREALLPTGPGPARFISLPAPEGYVYILLEDILRLHMDAFFPGEKILECAPFRITRNADMGVREDLASDLLVAMQDVLTARKVSGCVRMEHEVSATRILQRFLARTFKVAARDTYAVDGPVNFGDFFSLAGIDGFDDLQIESWPAQPSPQVDLTESLFKTLRQKDVLLYHPYDSFEPVVRMVEEAADDPQVVAIKQILYRTSKNSPIVAALRRAAEQGKNVTALVELKARFDEARNIEWARALELAGVQVIFGVKGLKTHAKLLLIVRREARGLVRYMHFGTGNYNEATARMYTDFSYLTCDEELGRDASQFMHTITGYSQPQDYRRIEAAPLTLRDRVLELIDAEIARKKQGQKARILGKMNSLACPKLIKALYRASQAGVEVKLNIRGICCLRPGVKGLSENIEVTSVVGRLLEHPRVFYFYHGGDEQVYLSSADWMPRNLDKRVELMTPIDEPASRKRIIKLLEISFKDNVKSRRLQSDGSYLRIPTPTTARKRVDSQALLYRKACEAVQRNTRSRQTVFEAHRPTEQK